MKLTRPTEIRAILAELDRQPNKTLGQHFLADANILDILLRAAAPTPDETVLEIGPGLGTITERLAEQARRVVAVEKDAALCRRLQERFAGDASVEIVCGDALDIDWTARSAAADGRLRLVAALPYNVASRILMEMATAADPPVGGAVIVQAEVARRLVAPPGTRDYGLPAIWLGLRYRLRQVREIAPSCFWPPPAVRSAIVAFTRRPPAETPGPAVRNRCRTLAQEAFRHRRKQLAGILKGHLGPTAPDGRPWSDWLTATLDAPPRARPENLTVEQWIRLAETLPSNAETIKGDPAR